MEKAQIYKELYARGLSDEDRVSGILKLLEGRRFARMLDIGCGDGSLTLHIARAVEAVTVKGIEIAPEGAARARENGIECACADFDRDELPYEGEGFDFIFCGEVIEHLFDPDRLIEYAAKVLNPGGRLLVTTPNLGAWHCRAYLLFGYNPYLCSVSLRHPQAGKMFGRSTHMGKEHIRFFTLRGLTDLLRLQGFTVLEKRGFGISTLTAVSFVPAPFSSILPFMEKTCSRLPSLASSVAVLCEKESVP